mgnify:CR=1 FL=1
MDEFTEDELYHAKLISMRNKFWTPELEKLFRKWRKQIGKKQQAHKLYCRKYMKRHYIIGVPATLLSAVVSAGVFITFRNCLEGELGCYPIADMIIRLISGIISLFSMVLSALFVFLGYQATAEQHKNAADSYEALLRDIDSTLKMPISFRGDPINTLQRFRDNFDDLAKNSPSLPSEYDIDLLYNVLDDDKRELVPPAPCNVSSVPQDTDKLAQLLNDSSHSSNPKSVELKIVNDYDTSDDEKEVTLGFDIESMRPDEISKNMRLNRQETSKALTFELERFHLNSTTPRSHIDDDQVSIHIDT